MLLGIFGLPGGAEWLVIGAVVLILFVPSLLFFALGYTVGRRSAAPPGAGAPASTQLPPDGRVASVDASAEDGTGSGDGPDA